MNAKTSDLIAARNADEARMAGMADAAQDRMRAYQGGSTSSSEVESLRNEVADLKAALAPLVKERQERQEAEDAKALQDAALKFDLEHPLSVEEREKFITYLRAVSVFNGGWVSQLGYKPDIFDVVEHGAVGAVPLLRRRKDGGR